MGRQNIRMRKTVLLVSYYAPPILNAESILVWKTLMEMSNHFDLKMLTSALPTGTRVDPELVLPGTIQVVRAQTYRPKSRLLGKLSDKALGWIWDEQYLWATLGRHDPGAYDILYSRSHPGASHILAYKLKQKTQKPWIAQFSDPWTHNPYHARHTRLRKTSDAIWERRVIHHADVLVFPTQEILDLYGQTFGSQNIAKKSIILPHHYVPELYQPEPSQPATAPSATVSFAYFGDFYGVRSPAPLVEALLQLAANDSDLLARVVVHFFGNLESKFTSIVDQSPVAITRGRVSYLDSLRQMRRSHVLLLIDAPFPNGSNPFLASKLIDYLGAGRPILGITSEKGTAANILREHGHYVRDPRDISGIAEDIKSCLKTTPSQFNPPSDFTTAHVVGRLVDVMTRL